MVIGAREAGAGLLILAALALGFRAFRPAADPVAKAVLRLDEGAQVPAIALDRLDRAAPEVGPPVRDVFKFGRDSRADLAPVPTPVISLPPVPPPVSPGDAATPGPTPWPLLDVSLIGIVDNGQGRRVGSFVKDGEILLVGEPGQVLGNAFRVVRLGTESAEIEELGSGRTRRLPLRTR